MRYQNSGNDEITVLGERFNEMADKTNQLIEQVYLSEIRRQKLQLSWKNAQLDAMLMQINPHFLYNTLDIIRWEAMYEANGESKVTRMIEQFSKLCRMGMKAGGNTISLKESLEHAQVYLEVINFRHQEKIRFLTDVGETAEKMLCPTVYAAADSGECGCSWISRCKQRVCGSDFCSRAGRGTSYSGEGQWNRYDKRKSGKASELYSRGSRSGKKVLVL